LVGGAEEGNLFGVEGGRSLEGDFGVVEVALEGGEGDLKGLGVFARREEDGGGKRGEIRELSVVPVAPIRAEGEGDHQVGAEWVPRGTVNPAEAQGVEVPMPEDLLIETFD
jgi:hypothetical protein